MFSGAPVCPTIRFHRDNVEVDDRRPHINALRALQRFSISIPPSRDKSVLSFFLYPLKKAQRRCRCPEFDL
jgi:hypothetical protein